MWHSISRCWLHKALQYIKTSVEADHFGLQKSSAHTTADKFDDRWSQATVYETTNK